VKRIPLWAKDGGIRAWVFVSGRDFVWLNQWRWSLGSHGYAYRVHRVDGKQRTIYMHRQILGLERGDRRMGEHENRNPLDCRRSNLRIAERGQLDNLQNSSLSAANTSGYRGVCWRKKERKWVAEVKLDGRKYHLGYFDIAEDADVVVKAFRAVHMPFSGDARVA
jgi:hypothetical protein